LHASRMDNDGKTKEQASLASWFNLNYDKEHSNETRKLSS